ncbi:3524_t:CDS:2 [Acaulospora morrowiae]|uniref:3524_t:CDS:1 n=1 Tax=Acaulospora morrowiae TaxID=94023 RepID=A0A9N9B2E1_9GLOM|nr:3524_t:CDS:2 [Acaulospora morrowiae]
MFSKQGSENENKSLRNNDNQIGQDQQADHSRYEKCLLEASISALTWQVQELAANYTKLITTTITQPRHRMKTKPNLQDITCYKCRRRATMQETAQRKDPILKK